MADANGAPPPGRNGQRHTGVVRRSDLHRARPSTARRDWLALVGVATLMVVVLVVLANFLGGKPVTNPSVSPTEVALVSQTPALKPTYSAEPTATPSPSPTPSPTRPPPPPPTPTPTPSQSPPTTPTPPPTPPPTPTALPTPSAPAPPTLPAVGLIVIDPVEGATVNDRVIAVRGLSQPGAPITHDVPLWFDDHTTADDAGLWSFNVELNVGWNAVKFRVSDDLSTQVTLNVYYAR